MSFNDCTVSSIKDSHLANRDIYHYTHVDGTKSVMEVLHDKAVPGAFHISNERYDPPKCHKDTRLTVRQDLLDHVTTAVVSCILWLYGAAGAGKSAIAQSFAETCQKDKLLIGTFFFFRAAPLRNNVRRLAASLAYQLARSIPSTFQHIARCITSHPAIFSSSLEDQIEELFVQPLLRACEEDPTLKPRPKLIILDGLDECDTADVQRNVLDVLEKVMQSTPVPVVVLITSRPETHICSSFESLERRASIQSFCFGLNDRYDVDGDIRLYLHHKFIEIKRDHPFRKCLPANYDWPQSEDVESIITKSSGQFIYAATIIRYIGHHKCNPHERLQTALDASKRFASTVHDSPFQELDALYIQIFYGLENTVTILAILYLALDIPRQGAQRPRTIAFHLGLGGSDVEIYISSLASLMKYEGEEKPIRFFHASLQDFLVDEHRSHHLCIQQPAVHTALSEAYLHRFLESESAPYVLGRCSAHLGKAKMDQDLSVLITKVASKIPEFIKTFCPVLVPREWKDYGDANRAFYFYELVMRVETLITTITTVTEILNFWDQCLEAIYILFHKQLSTFLTDDTTHDLLALLAFTLQDDVLHRPHFASSFGISESASKMCEGVHLFSAAKGEHPLRAFSRDIIREFLLDPHLSGKLYITSERCAQVAMKCLGIVKTTCLLEDLKDRRASLSGLKLSDEEDTYLFAVRGLGGMLRKASEYPQLVEALEQFNCDMQWLSYYRDVVKEVREAVDSYLKKYSSNSPPVDRANQEVYFEEPTVIEDESIPVEASTGAFEGMVDDALLVVEDASVAVEHPTTSGSSEWIRRILATFECFCI